MATGSTIHTFDVDISDVDRGVYESVSLRVAQHPSETAEFMLTRLLAYCLEYEPGIAFGGGISAADEPAVMVTDATGALRAWIEVGAPDAERLHRGSMAAERTAVYTHRDPERVAAAWAGKRIHRADGIPLRSFDPGFVADAAASIQRRNHLVVAVTEHTLYLDINGVSSSSPIHSRPAG